MQPTESQNPSDDIGCAGVLLLSLGGLYWIGNNGCHRVAALKGLGIEGLTVPARVQMLDYEGMISFCCSQPDHLSRFGSDPSRETMLAQRANGGWNGDFDEGTGIGLAHTYAGPWVFAANMTSARKLYEALRPDFYRLS